jgi:hypothetical protein
MPAALVARTRTDAAMSSPRFQAPPALAAYTARFVRVGAAGNLDLSPAVACTTHRQSKYLHCFEPSVVIGPGVKRQKIRYLPS